MTVRLFLLSFFICLSITPVTAIDWAMVDAEIEEKSLYSSPQWQALLHISEGRRWIDTEEFLLSHADFSYEREMRSTLRYLYSDNSAVCRFPARYQWLANELSALPELSLEHCEELQTFLDNAPVEEVALVFASENLKSPSSMMGHIFLNIAGQRQTGEDVEYSVSFFTDVDTWNVPRVFYESIVTGRPGYFALSPYQDQILRYLHQEHRNVWRYQLDMNSQQRQIVQYHLFELRDIELTYYFHAYNCATLVNFVIAHAEPALLTSTRPWLTPLGVIRESSSLVSEVTLRPSTQWLIRAYSETLPDSLLRNIRDDFSEQQDELNLAWLTGLERSNEGFLALETARALNDYRFESREQDQQQWEANEASLDRVAERSFAGFTLDLSEYKDPLKSPKDRQFQVGYSYQQSTSYMQISLLPASHRLDDDNRQYFGESGLQIGELSLLVEPESGDMRVEHFHLYGMQSLMPQHTMMSTLSASIGLGYDQHYDDALRRHGAWYVQGAVGRTWRLHPSFDLYTMAGGGAAYAPATAMSYLYLDPRVGVFVRQNSRAKLHAELATRINQLHSDAYTELSLTQSFYSTPSSTWVINARKRFSHRTHKDDYEFSVAFKRYF